MYEYILLIFVLLFHKILRTTLKISVLLCAVLCYPMHYYDVLL